MVILLSNPTMYLLVPKVVRVPLAMHVMFADPFYIRHDDFKITFAGLPFFYLLQFFLSDCE